MPTRVLTAMAGGGRQGWSDTCPQYCRGPTGDRRQVNRHTRWTATREGSLLNKLLYLFGPGTYENRRLFLRFRFLKVG